MPERVLRMAEYIYGRRKELQVGEFLERRRFKWERSQGSRGPIDLVAQRGSTKIAIQVKATRKDYTSYTKLTIDGESRLIKAAKRINATPVLALVSKNYLWLVSVPDNEILLKGKLRKLKYDYE